MDLDNLAEMSQKVENQLIDSNNFLAEMREKLAKFLPPEAKKPQFDFTDQPICYKRRFKNSLKHETLKKQLIKRTNASVFEFSAKRETVYPSSISQLADAIKSASPTRKLHIKWAHDLENKISLNERSYYHQSLKLLYCLQILNITLPSESDAGLKCLGQSLKALTSLQNLTLSIESGFSWDFSLTDIGLYHLSQGIKRLPMLKKLNLSFAFLRGITDAGLNFLSKGLRKLIHLEEISLAFRVGKNMTDVGLSHLSESLGKLCFLKSFRFDMSHSREITDKGLESLSKNLELLNSLEYVCLDFKECPEITDEGLNFLSRALKKQVHLKSIEMDFSGCIKITDEAVHNFSEILLTFVSLKNLEFNITNCPQVTEKEFQFMSETVEKHTSQVMTVLYFSDHLNGSIFPQRGLDKKLEELKKKLHALEIEVEEDLIEETLEEP